MQRSWQRAEPKRKVLGAAGLIKQMAGQINVVRTEPADPSEGFPSDRMNDNVLYHSRSEIGLGLALWNLAIRVTALCSATHSRSLLDSPLFLFIHGNASTRRLPVALKSEKRGGYFGPRVPTPDGMCRIVRSRAPLCQEGPSCLVVS
jgi:hypothetical protein